MKLPADASHTYETMPSALQLSDPCQMRKPLQSAAIIEFLPTFCSQSNTLLKRLLMFAGVGVDSFSKMLAP